MNEKENWDIFYKTVGGKYICSECGHIMSWVQYDLSDRTSGKGWLIGFLIAFILTFILPGIGTIIGVIYLLKYAPKRGCPTCGTKQNKIFRLDNKEGMNIFKNKYPEYVYLLDKFNLK